MIEDVRPEGCICEPCSDISTGWKDIRTKFGYTMLYGIWRLIEYKSNHNSSEYDAQI